MNVKRTKKGQSIQHIIASNPDKCRYSISNTYKLISQHKTNVDFFDLKLKVKLKPRKNAFSSVNSRLMDIHNNVKYKKIIIKKGNILCCPFLFI